MTKKSHFHHRKLIKSESEGEERKKRLEIVLKCDSVGSLEALISSLKTLENPEVKVSPIHTGIGAISKSDLLMALTGSRLVVGFNVSLLPKMEQLSKEKGVEIRLYDVIYKLTQDLSEIARSLIYRHEEKERIAGKAKVIALFKSSRKGVILGCEVLEGALFQGKNFRVISAMGPVYSGKIESLHIEKDAVKEAKVGQKVGLKISDFNRAKKGDLVETYEKLKPETRSTWHPRGRVFVIS
jgi:translation initiation factor IF-2